MSKNVLILFIAVFIIGINKNTYGQRNLIIVESVVKNSNGQPVPGALVSGNEGAVEAITDADGKFTIQVRDRSSLLVEAEGYEVLNIALFGSDLSEIILHDAIFLMGSEDMVNIAFGKVKKKEVIGAVSVINSEKIRTTDANENISSTLLGKFPGLLANNYLRGLGSALIVVDGIPRDPSTLNLSEIDQVTVLKDGHSAILWGSAAKNGVIQITTKRGQALKREVKVSIDQGFATPVVLPEYLGSAEYFKLYNEALTNDGFSPSRTEETIALYNGSNPYRYPDVDYYSSEYLKNKYPTSRILTEFGGGNDNTQYYANVGWNRRGYLYNLGEAANMGSNRFNMRANVDFKINSFIKSTLDGVFIVGYSKNPAGNFWSDASTLHPDYYSPLLPISMMNDSPAIADKLATAKLINGQYILGGTQQYTSNPYGNMFLAGYVETYDRVATINNTIDFNLNALVSGLSFKTFFMYDVYNMYNMTIDKTYAIYTPTWDADGKITNLTTEGRDWNTGNKNMPMDNRYFERKIGGYAMFDYHKTFSKVHTVSGVLLGYFNRLRGNNTIIDRKNAHLGLRLAYDYNKKYFADFSSNYTHGYYLKPGNRGGYSPSLGLAWVISEEDFMNNDFIDYLKIRTSASIQNLDLAYLTTGRPYELSYVSSGSNFAWGDGAYSSATYVPTKTANNNLTFEKMSSINFGFEGYFFNRILYAEGNVFKNNWTGQVVRQGSIYPAYVGAFYPYENYNNTKYSGIELGLVLSESVGDFSFELGTNFMYASSKRTKVREVWANDYQYRSGKPNDAIFGMEALGLFQNENEIANSPKQTFSVPKPGDIKYKDQNDDGVINNDDQVEIGNSLPKLSYGINILLRYGNFSLMATGTGYGGFDYILSNDYFWVDGNKKYSAEVLNRWTPSTATTATYPRLSSSANTNNHQYSTYWLKDGKYFNLNRVQLTYHIPESILKNWIIKGSSVYVRGSNLGMLCPDSEKRQLNIGSEPN